LADDMVIPRGKYIGRGLRATPKDESEHLSGVRRMDRLL
jgi:hypothetical protein